MLDKVGEASSKGGEVAKTGETEVVSETAQHLDEFQLDTVSKIPEDSKSFGYYLGRFLLVIFQAIMMVAIIAGSLYLMRTMIASKPEPRKRPAFKTIYTVDTVIAKKADYQPGFISYGQTTAARSVDLRALVSGEIIKINAKLRAGARVEKGEALVEIDDFNYRGALSEAKANWQEASARIGENEAQIVLEQGRVNAALEQLELAEFDLARIQRLKQRRTSTQKEVEARKLIVSQRKQALAQSRDMIKIQQSRLAQIKASIARLDWRVRQAERNLESTTLVAPFTGIVRSSSAEIGRAITANDVVVSLYEADTLEVKFTLTDAQYGRLQISDAGLINRPVKVVWSVGGADYIYPAIVDRVGAEIISTRGGVELFARVVKAENTITIRPGAFVEVRVPDRLFKDSFSIPDTSIYGTATVYVKVDGKLEKREVSIAAFEGERAIISSGLKDGDEVLVTRITEVSEGLRVRREDEAALADKASGEKSKPETKPEEKKE